MTKQQMIEVIRESVIIANNHYCKSYDEYCNELMPLCDLTLERILVALPTAEINARRDLLVYVTVREINHIQFEWKLNTLLENQSDKTIEKIYKILINQ